MAYDVHIGLCPDNVQISLEATEFLGPSNVVVNAENLRVSRKPQNCTRMFKQTFDGADL